MSTTALYPPVKDEELRCAHGFSNIVRVVVGQNAVYGLTSAGEWLEFRPLRSWPEASRKVWNHG